MFFKETAFQETSIGDIPKDWNYVELGKIAKIKGGKRLPKEDKLVDCKTAHPYIRVIDFKNMTVNPENLKYISPRIHEKIRRYTISSNDVYISIAGTVGLVGTVPPDLDRANLTENAAKICELQNIDNKFLAYALSSDDAQSQIQALMGKGTQPKLALFRICKLRVPLTSLPEQKRIVEVLSCVDLAIQKTDEVIVKTEKLKKGLMQKLMTEGIGHKEFKDTEIGKIPKGWEVVTIGDVCTQRNEMFQPSGLYHSRFIGLEHIVSGETRISDCVKYVAVKSSKFKFYAGDILYGKLRPYLDKAAMAEFDGICSTDLIVLKHKDTILKELLTYVLHSDRFLGHAMATTSGTNHPRTSWSAISKFRLGLPKPEEQQKISEILTTIDRKLQFEKMEKTKLDRIKLGFMVLLLTGKVRVRMD